MTTFRLGEDPIANKEGGTTVTETKEINPTTSQPKVPGSEENKPEQIKEIILKGPLSHAYTEALNMLLDRNNNPSRELRQESVQMALHATVLAEEAEPDETIPDSAKAYIYVYDGKKLGLNDVTDMFDQITMAKEQHPANGMVGVVLENASDAAERRDIQRSLEQFAISMEHFKVPMFFSQKAAFNSIVSFIQGA